MAGMNVISREQLGAIALLRWRLFVNSLRSVRGRLNLVSRSFAGLLIVGAGVGGGIAIGAAAWGITREQNLVWLAIPFWLISIFWQLFPVMASAFTQNIDSSSLLRFPLTYSSYFLVRMIYGALDIPTTLGLCWSLGLLIGICTADAALLPWAALSVGGIVVFNLLLARMIFVWIERWLSLRRSREVISLIFLALIICSQLAGPMLGRYDRLPMTGKFRVLRRLVPVERALPPGLSANVLQSAAEGRTGVALLCLLALVGYAGAVLLPLHLRLRAQYEGEVISSGEARREAQPRERGALRRGWKLPFVSGPVSAMFEKEAHYFSRSGPMLFALIMPVVVIVILWGGRKGFFQHRAEYLFPVGAAYCLLVMNNILYNSFGGDGGGIQFLLLSPVSFRQIVFAKNLAQCSVLLAEVLVLWVAVSFLYQPPGFSGLVLTLAWYTMAAPLNFSAGNLLSLYSPKRIDYSTFGRQRASESAILVSLTVQFAGVGLGALAIFAGYHYGNIWIAALILAVLGAPSVAGYLILLRRIDGIAMGRREALTTELCRAQA